MTTRPTNSAPPELDALVRAAVFAAWALGSGNMADRVQAHASLKAAVWPFVRGVSMDGDEPPEGFDVHVPYGVVSGQLQRMPDTRRAPMYGERSPARNGHSGGDTDRDIDPDDAPPLAELQHPRDRDIRRDIPTPSPTAPGPSRWRINGAALSGTKALPVPVRGEWKPLGECTHEDLAAVVDHYTRLAGRNERRAGQFRRLLQALYDHEEDTVGDLPTVLIEGVLKDDQG